MNLRSGALQTPPVVKNLLIVNVLFFMAQDLLPHGLGSLLQNKLALYFWESPNFYPWQYVTHMFLHANFTHLFFNMFALWMFGRILEYDLGSKRFLSFYLITGISAAILYSCVNWAEVSYLKSHLTTPEALQTYLQIVRTPTVGASGAIYGVLLAFGMMHPNSVIMLLIPPIPIKAKYFVLIFMVLELYLGFTQSDNVAHFAHVSGMICGFILLRYWKVKGRIHY